MIKNVIFLLYLIHFFVNCSKNPSMYKENISKRSLELSQMTYCGKECDDDCILEYEVENMGSKALIGYDNITQTIFTAFRGSSNMHNWIENIQVYKISPYDDEKIEVEGGFYKDYEYIKDQIFENLYILSTKYETKSLLITGHSLGAAASTLMAYDIYNMNDFEIEYFYNFGSPRVGNDEFVKDFNSKIEGYRVVHNNDMITVMPPMSFNYEHISQGVCYNEESSDYEYCENTDCNMTTCSTDDHIHYMNITMGSNGC